MVNSEQCGIVQTYIRKHNLADIDIFSNIRQNCLTMCSECGQVVAAHHDQSGHSVLCVLLRKATFFAEMAFEWN
jgi:hypothetical protein